MKFIALIIFFTFTYMPLINALDLKKNSLDSVLNAVQSNTKKVGIENFTLPELLKILLAAKNNMRLVLKPLTGPTLQVQHFTIKTLRDVQKLLAALKPLQQQKVSISLRLHINSLEDLNDILQYSHLIYALYIESINPGLNPPEIMEMLSSARFNQLKILNLHNLGLSDEDLGALFQYRFKASLQALILSDNQLTPDSMQLLSENTSLKSLKLLDLGNSGHHLENHIEDEGFSMLMESSTFRMLESVNVSHNGLTGDALKSLHRSGLTKLERLNLAGNSFTARDIQRLGQIDSLKKLKVLELESIQSGPAASISHGAEAFRNWTKVKNIEDIVYEFNDEEVDSIARQSSFSKLKTLKGIFTLEGIKALAASNHIKKLEELILKTSPEEAGTFNGNGIMEIVADDANFEKLKIIKFIKAGLTNRTLTALAYSKTLKNLQRLYLQDNAFSDDGIINLAYYGNFPNLEMANIQGYNSLYTIEGAGALSTSKAFPKLRRFCIKFKQYDQDAILKLGSNFSKVFQPCGPTSIGRNGD